MSPEHYVNIQKQQLNIKSNNKNNCICEMLVKKSKKYGIFLQKQRFFVSKEKHIIKKKAGQTIIVLPPFGKDYPNAS